MSEINKKIRSAPMVDPMLRSKVPGSKPIIKRAAGKLTRPKPATATHKKHQAIKNTSNLELQKPLINKQETVPQTEDQWNSIENMRLEEMGDESDSSSMLVVKKRFFADSKHRKKLVIIGIVLVVLGVAGGIIGWKFARGSGPASQANTNTQSPSQKATPTPTPTTAVSPLSGVTVPIEATKQPLLAVMIENSPDARPQSGLKDAGIVYEAVAEGGITRFMAIFQEGKPAKIGPIRSARPYFLDWLLPYDAAYAHVGGSTEALAQIQSLKIKDMDEFANGAAYYRDPKRYAPHNAYSSTESLRKLIAGKGYVKSTFSPLPRKPDQPSGAAATARTINLSISSLYYNVNYVYDAGCNCYKRSEGGNPHIDETGNVQLAPKTVLALVIPRSLHGDGVHTVYDTVGSGTLKLFQDGTATDGTWEKPDRDKAFTFRDAAGKALSFNAGQLWITMVQDTGSITYTP